MRTFAGSTESKGRTANRTWLSIFKNSSSMNDGATLAVMVGGTYRLGKIIYMVASRPCEILSQKA